MLEAAEAASVAQEAGFTETHDHLTSKLQTVGRCR